MKKCMEFRVEDRRPVGRPRRTWLKSVEADMAELEIDKEDFHDRKSVHHNKTIHDLNCQHQDEQLMPEHHHFWGCCCLPTAMWGETDLSICGPPASFSVHPVSSAVTPVGSVHKSRGDNVMHMCAQSKR